jgi:hypothetical protein
MRGYVPVRRHSTCGDSRGSNNVPVPPGQPQLRAPRYAVVDITYCFAVCYGSHVPLRPHMSRRASHRKDRRRLGSHRQLCTSLDRRWAEQCPPVKICAAEREGSFAYQSHRLSPRPYIRPWPLARGRPGPSHRTRSIEEDARPTCERESEWVRVRSPAVPRGVTGGPPSRLRCVPPPRVRSSEPICRRCRAMSPI